MQKPYSKSSTAYGRRYSGQSHLPRVHQRSVHTAEKAECPPTRARRSRTISRLQQWQQFGFVDPCVCRLTTQLSSGGGRVSCELPGRHRRLANGPRQPYSQDQRTSWQPTSHRLWLRIVGNNLSILTRMAWREGHPKISPAPFFWPPTATPGNAVRNRDCSAAGPRPDLPRRSAGPGRLAGRRAWPRRRCRESAARPGRRQ